MSREKTEAAAAFFAAELLNWYDANKRDLPWRRDRDPYRIWVSEVMLQQTRVDTVIPYYERFMERFPTVRHLAEAPEEEVLKCWEGLGYYSRARNLQAGARQVVELYGGVVPDDKAAISSLKGIGPYTAGAILSIAYNKPEPAVDGNVMRVMSRYFLLEDDIAKPSARTKIERLAASIIPEGRAGDFNQAVMELGALVCTPKSPGCLLCPVLAQCAGRAAGRERELPVKSKAKPPRPELRLAALVEGRGEHAGKVLVRRRPDSGLLARMWELPHMLAPDEAAAVEAGAGHGRFDALSRGLAEEAGLLVRPERLWTEEEHVFSHIRWKVDVYLAEFGFFLEGGREAAAGAVSETVSEAASEAASGVAAETGAPYGGRSCGEEPPDGWLWIGPGDMASLAFPNVFLRILNDYFARRT
ncbi:A/G-specific adenine glycosylase [Thermobacillus composti KWC4]|uniref:Adenine DNA glycosylase n=1 Tax=Thermobacillus composti (strain DSM 18247 / JCM 13945 / KWC4) TaxID=717605 RepID=L0EAH7_THECK|nr:A/G-specific adenine glycosylase [Thermobacillus composti]AGA56782.1 A/G-specific adenine glycosylase [Thermobacillus composti KWC4]